MNQDDSELIGIMKAVLDVTYVGTNLMYATSGIGYAMLNFSFF